MSVVRKLMMVVLPASFILFAPCGYCKTVLVKNGFTIIPIHGDPIDVISMTVEPEQINVLFYTRKDGTNGFIDKTNIKNVNELLGVVQADSNPSQADKIIELGKEQDRLSQEIKTRERNLQEKLAEMQAEANRQQYQGIKGTNQSIREWCRKRWPNDYEMMEHCIKTQSESFGNLTRYSGPILQKCLERWDADYTMVEHCVKNQTEAKKRIGY